MTLQCVTITGADDGNDPAELVKLANDYPFVEWGILVGSETRYRFPSYQWIRRFIDAGEGELHLSLHICGGFLRQIARGEPSLSSMSALLKHFKRCQLNWHAVEQKPGTGPNVVDAFNRMPWSPQIIYQLDGVNSDLRHFAINAGLKCSGLFDASHGAGVSPGEWPQRLEDFYCGYAGGLGPDNVAEELPRIAEAAGGYEHWIDMETKVCTDNGNGLDLDAVEKVLRKCEVAAVS